MAVESLFGESLLLSHKDPPRLFTIPTQQRQIRRLELELHRQHEKRLTQNRRLEQEMKELIVAPKKPSGVRVAPVRKVKLGEDAHHVNNIDEAMLYKLFVKHSSAAQIASRRKLRSSQEDAEKRAEEEKKRVAVRVRVVEGGLDAWELQALIKELGLLAELDKEHQERAASQWLKQLDADGNGTVEWMELKAWWTQSRGRYTVRAKTTGEKASERLQAPSHWLNRRRRGRRSQWSLKGAEGAEGAAGAASADGEMPRPPPPRLALDDASNQFALIGIRPASARLERTVPRQPASTNAQRRLQSTEKWHGNTPRSARPHRPAPAPTQVA